MKSTFLTVSAALLGTLFTAGSLHAQVANPAQKLAAQADSSCKQTNDPFEVAYKYTANSEKFAGQCIDSNRFRVIQNLKIENGTLSLNNYQHEKEYWEAKLSVQDVENVYVHVVRFPIAGVVEAAHIQIRFKLKNPVQLKNQIDGRKTTANDLMVSFEASRPKDIGYNFALGVMENYSLIGKVSSTAQKKIDGSNPFEQYELDLSAEEKSQLLQIALNRAAKITNEQFYSTLRPNCATEVFDAIDSLPRLKGKFRSFLTVISNDPVAKPSIAALQARKILKRRVQNFEDEVKGVIKDIPVGSTTTQHLVPQVANHSWTLLVTLPRLDKLTPNERAAVLKVRADLLQTAPLLVQALGSSFMTEAGLDASKILSSTVTVLQGRLLTILKSLNQNLPNTKQHLGLYLVPLQMGGATTSLQKFGIPAELPFAVRDVEIEEGSREATDTYFQISEGTRKAGDSGAKLKDPAYLMGAAVKLQIARDASSFHSQLLVGLNDIQKPFGMTNSQVAFKQAVVKGAQARLTRPTLLLTHAQPNLGSLNPLVKIEFGPEGGLAGRMNPDNFAIFQIRKELNGNCSTQAESSPALLGNLAATALNKPVLDKLIAGKAVAFKILGVNLNAKTRRVEAMDVRVATWPMNCLSVQNVNDQFAQQANQMFKKLEADAKNGNLVQSLIQKLLAR